MHVMLKFTGKVVIVSFVVTALLVIIYVPIAIKRTQDRLVGEVVPWSEVLAEWKLFLYSSREDQ